MTSLFQHYPAYKNSGSEMLGRIPDHWRVQNLRTLITKRVEKNRANLPLLSVAREKGVFVRSLTDPDENHNVIPDDLSNYKAAYAGDLVINKMKAWQGSMGIAPCDGIVSPAYFVFVFGVANRRYGQWLLRSKPYVAHFGQASDGVRVGQWDLSVPRMRQIPVLLPPPDEQDAIVRFLDYHDRLIRKYIQTKQKLIALLTEQKQAIIQHAVTRGLNPDVQLKPSGEDWLGNIPEHWSVRRGKYLIHEVNSRSPEGSEPLLRVSQYTGVTRRTSEDRTGMPSARSLVGYKRARKDDLVVNIMIAWNGSLGVAPEDGIVSPAYCVYRFVDGLGPWYMHHLLRSPLYGSRIKRASTGIIESRLRLYSDDLGRIEVLIPPLEEQKEIASNIQVATSGLDDAITRAEKQIALMREYRTRLTADVVTGKIDVREAAAALPAIEDEPPIADTDLEEPTDAEEALDAD